MLPTILSSTLLLPFYLSLTAASPVPNDQTCSLDSYTVVSSNATVWPYRQYRSTNLTSPQLNITRNGGQLAPGLIFLGVDPAGPVLGEKSLGPLIISDEGKLVWAGPRTLTNNFRAQTVNKKPAISFWRGSGSAAAGGSDSHGYGMVEVYDDSYHKLYTVCPKIDILQPPGQNASCVADVHESYITVNNTMLITVYNTTRADLSSVNGPKDGWVLDPLAVEVDLATNNVLWSWSPLAHVPVNASHSPLQGTGSNSSQPFDFFHTNSIQPFDSGYLINSRATWTSYFINRAGEIQWKIDGAHGGDFGSLPDGAQFSWQHHARLHATSTPNEKLLTLFADNNADLSTNETSYSVGLLLTLPPSPASPPKLWSHLNNPADPVVSYAEGSYQLIDDSPAGQNTSNAFIDYGIRPVMEEYGPSDKTTGGELRWSAQFGYRTGMNAAQSYRAFKQKWNATPTTPIDLAVGHAASNDSLTSCAGDSQLRGYASWNGATGVQSYCVYAGSGENNLQKASDVQAKGFETEFVVPADAKAVQVVAVRDGKEVGRSAVVSVS